MSPPKSARRSPRPLRPARPRPTRRPARALLAAAGAVGACLLVGSVLVGCGADPSPGASPSAVDPVVSQLQIRIGLLPMVGGSTKGESDIGARAVRQTWTVPAGSPACLQILAVLDAAGYTVVAGDEQDKVDPTTCTTAAGDPSLSPAGGTTTVLAQGGSQLTLTWTPETYTLEADAE